MPSSPAACKGGFARSGFADLFWPVKTKEISRYRCRRPGVTSSDQQPITQRRPCLSRQSPCWWPSPPDWTTASCCAMTERWWLGAVTAKAKPSSHRRSTMWWLLPQDGARALRLMRLYHERFGDESEKKGEVDSETMPDQFVRSLFRAIPARPLLPVRLVRWLAVQEYLCQSWRGSSRAQTGRIRQSGSNQRYFH